MCSPIAAGAGAMMAGSVLANSIGANQQNDARNAVLNNALTVQQGFQNDSTNEFNATLPLASRASADANASTDAGVRAARDTSLLASSGAPIPAPNSAGPADVRSAYGSAMRDSLNRGTIQAVANSKVGGVADANQALGINLAKAGQWQKIFASNMTNSAALVPGELSNANYAGGTARGIGGILGAAGQATGMAGMAGAGSGLTFFDTPPVGGGQGPPAPGIFTKIFG